MKHNKSNIQTEIYFAYFLGIANNPGAEGSNIGIDTGVVGVSASVSPGDNTDEDSTGDQWATGVTLAGILAAGSSANHGAADLATVSVGGGSTLALANDVHVHVLQLGGDGAGSGRLGTPTGNGGRGSVSWVVSGQANSLDA